MADSPKRPLDEVFEAALQQEPARRIEFLRRVCAGDDELLAKVQSLVAEYEAAGSTVESQPTLTVGECLNSRYLIEREIGRGGFGVVYLARDLQLHSKTVVVKALIDRADDGWSRRKFREECEALTRINHPGVVQV